MPLDKPYLDIPGTTIFDAEQSRKGYWLNQFCMSLMKSVNRERFKSDERAYLDEDPQREGLRDTPQRAAKAMAFMTEGYRKNLQDIVNDAVFESDNDEMVLVRDIELYSLCEHHLLPFIGRCHVAYLPAGKVIGLSKIARITDMFARRLQIQENLTLQIANAVAEVTAAKGVS